MTRRHLLSLLASLPFLRRFVPQEPAKDGSWVAFGVRVYMETNGGPLVDLGWFESPPSLTIMRIEPNPDPTTYRVYCVSGATKPTRK